MRGYPFFVICFLGGFFCCTPPESQLTIPNEEQIMVNHQSHTLGGDFYVQTTGSEWVISNTHADPSNPFKDIVFTLQAEKVSDFQIEVTEGKAYWNEHEVLIVDYQNQDVYRFAISGRTQSDFLAAFPPEFSDHLQEESLGFGFGYLLSPQLGSQISNWIEGNPNTSVFTASIDRQSPVANIAPDDKDCPSGGEGASSCSASVGNASCSITCKSGYYACCSDGPGNSVSCKCVKE